MLICFINKNHINCNYLKACSFSRKHTKNIVLPIMEGMCDLLVLKKIDQVS